MEDKSNEHTPIIVLDIVTNTHVQRDVNDKPLRDINDKPLPGDVIHQLPPGSSNVVVREFDINFINKNGDVVFTQRKKPSNPNRVITGEFVALMYAVTDGKE